MDPTKITYDEMYIEVVNLVDAAITNREPHFLRSDLRAEYTQSMDEKLDEPPVEVENAVSANANNAGDACEERDTKKEDILEEKAANGKEEKGNKDQDEGRDTEEPLSWIEMVLMEEKQKQDEKCEQTSNETDMETNSGA